MSSAFSATRWVLLGSVGFRVLAYVGQALIFWVVAKEVVGAYGGLVDIHLMMMSLFPLAIDSLLIKEKLRRRRFSMALSMGLLLTGALAVLGTLAALLLPAPGASSFAARWAGEGASWHAVLFMLPIFAIMATKLSARSLLAADLDFKRISIGEFGNGLLTYFGGAAAVMFFPSAWALMAAYMLGEIFECLWMYRRFHFRIAVLAPRRWGVFTAVMKRHWNFCLINTADLTLSNAASQIPGPLIVALVSATAAADFRASRILIQLPILLLVGAIWRVAYPTISGVSEAVLQSRCLRIIGTTAGYLVPGVIWLAFFATSTAVLLGGNKYASAAPLVQWMAGYMALTAIFSPISALDMIRDKSHWGLAWNVVHTITRVTVIVVFAKDGLLAVIAAMSINSLLLWVVWAAMLGEWVGCGLATYTMRVLKFAPAWALLAGAFWLCHLVTGGHLILAPALSVIPGLIYLAVVFKLFPEESEMVRKLVLKR